MRSLLITLWFVKVSAAFFQNATWHREDQVDFTLPAVHIRGTTWYGGHSTAIGHFIRGYLLSTFARLQEHGLWATPHLSFDEPTMPKSAKLPGRFDFINAIRPTGAKRKLKAPRNAVILDLSHESTSDCRFSADLADWTSSFLGITPRAGRKLQLILLRRGKSRFIRNWDELRDSLKAVCQELNITFIAPDFSKASAVSTLKLVAASDIFVTMHGSGSNFAAFLPPRSLVLEFMPKGLHYCLQSGCHSHAEMVWVQLIHSGLTWSECEGPNCSRDVNSDALAGALRRAWKGRMWNELGLIGNIKSRLGCTKMPLERWLSESPVQHAGDSWCKTMAYLRNMDEKQPAAYNMISGASNTSTEWPPDTLAYQWPSCINGFIEA